MASNQTYRELADEALQRACGIGYDEFVSDLSPRIDRANQLLIQCEMQGRSPERFAELFCRKNKLVLVDDVGHDEAVEYNQRRAAIIEFVASSRWSMDTDGRAVLPTRNGEMFLDVVKRDGRYGFMAKIDNVGQCSRLDIGNAIVGLVTQMRRIPKRDAGDNNDLIQTNIEPQEQSGFSMR